MLKSIASRIALAALVLPMSLYAATNEGKARDYNYSDKVYVAPQGAFAKFFSRMKTGSSSIVRGLPSCDDDSVLALMADRSNWAQDHTWHNDSYVFEISRTHEHGLLDGLNRYGEERLINRRYCGADVMTTTGKKHYVWYLIEQGQGLASMGWNVNFCMAPRDRWKVNDGSCRSIRIQY